MKRTLSLFISIIILLFGFQVTVFAASDNPTLQIYFTEDGKTLRIFLSEEVSEDSVIMVGNESLTPSIKNSDIEIKTIFLIDNSISIPQSLRENIKDSVLSYAYSMPLNESIKIVKFDAEISDITSDYSQDPKIIELALSKFDFTGKSSPVYDALMETTKENYADEDVYYRTVLITDGANRVGNVSFDLLRTELDKNNRYHVDVVQVSEKSVQDVNLNAISSLGSNTYTMFDEDGNLLSLIPDEVSMLKVSMKNSLTTGEYKGVTVKDGSKNISLGSILFPQVEMEDEPSLPEIPAVPVISSEEEENGTDTKFIIIVVCLCVTVAVIAVAALLLFKNLRKNKKCRIKVHITKDDNRDVDGIGERFWEFDVKKGYRVGRILNPTNEDGSPLPVNQMAICECATKEDISSIGRNAFLVYYDKNKKSVAVKNIAQRAFFYVEVQNRNEQVKSNESVCLEKGSKILLGNYTNIEILEITFE